MPGKTVVVGCCRELEDYRELAEATGMHPGTISKLKNNLSDRLEMQTLLKLCKALDCQPGDLLRYIPDAEWAVIVGVYVSSSELGWTGDWKVQCLIRSLKRSSYKACEFSANGRR